MKLKEELACQPYTMLMDDHLNIYGVDVYRIQAKKDFVYYLDGWKPQVVYEGDLGGYIEDSRCLPWIHQGWVPSGSVARYRSGTSELIVMHAPNPNYIFRPGNCEDPILYTQVTSSVEVTDESIEEALDSLRDALRESV